MSKAVPGAGTPQSTVGTGLVIEFPPTTADRLRAAAQRNDSTPAALAEKALRFWLSRDEHWAARKAARDSTRLLLERIRAEERRIPQPPGSRKEEAIPR